MPLLDFLVMSIGFASVIFVTVALVVLWRIGPPRYRFGAPPPVQYIVVVIDPDEDDDDDDEEEGDVTPDIDFLGCRDLTPSRN
jgi:hypothetical protein